MNKYYLANKREERMTRFNDILMISPVIGIKLVFRAVKRVVNTIVRRREVSKFGNRQPVYNFLEIPSSMFKENSKSLVRNI